MFDNIERVAKIIQNLVIIFGIFGGVISLAYTLYDKRVERSIGFSKDYNATVRKSYLSLVSTWNNYAQKHDFFQKDENGQKELIAKFFSEDQNSEQNFSDLLDFYDTLYACVNSRSCDRNTALDFFYPSTLFESFAFHIFDLREVYRDKSIGKGLEEMYRSPRESWWHRYL